jgi:DNA-binding XRE family transcriptional regulator
MKNKFNEKLKELRKEIQLLQKQLASDLGVTQVCVAKWETGTREPSLDMLIKLAKYFNVTTDYLLGLED